MSHDQNLINDYSSWHNINGCTNNSVTSDDDENDYETPEFQIFIIAGFFVIWHSDNTMEIIFNTQLIWSGKALDYCV